MKQYEADLAAIKKAKEDNDADYQAKLAAYQAELARVQKANAEAKEAYDKAVKENTAKIQPFKLKMKLLSSVTPLQNRIMKLR